MWSRSGTRIDMWVTDWPSSADRCHVTAARWTERWKDRPKSINHGPNRRWEGSHRRALHFRLNYRPLMTPISPGGRQRQNFWSDDWNKSGGNPLDRIQIERIWRAFYGAALPLLFQKCVNFFFLKEENVSPTDGWKTNGMQRTNSAIE